MWSFVIVLLSPVTDNALGFLDRGKQPAMQTAIAKDAVAALVMPVLPRTPRVNKVQVNRLLAQPGRHALCDAFRTVITFAIHRSAMWRKRPPQHLDDIRRRDRAGTGDLQALSSAAGAESTGG